MIWFGPAGNSESFTSLGYKGTAQIADYVERMGLNAYEYQCGRGVRVNAESGAALREKSKEKGIRLSLHSPYYISLSGVEEEKRLGSIRYIMESAAAARLLGADRVVVHTGSATKISREDAVALSKDTLRRALAQMDEAGYGDIALCPETMGKFNQLGTPQEVAEICAIDDRLVPCIDFGHVNARTLGGLKTPQDFEKLLLGMADVLGMDRMKAFHAHFSKIEYTEKGGELRHLTFEDTTYGPEFEPLAEVICKYGCTPVIICESAGTQAEDAAAMRDIYQKTSDGTGR